jgi:polyphosphate kinase
MSKYSEPTIVCLYTLDFEYRIEHNTLYFDGANLVVVVESEDATILKLIFGKDVLNIIPVKAFDAVMDLLLEVQENPTFMAIDPMTFWVRACRQVEKV